MAKKILVLRRKSQIIALRLPQERQGGEINQLRPPLPEVAGDLGDGEPRVRKGPKKGLEVLERLRCALCHILQQSGGRYGGTRSGLTDKVCSRSREG